ncbi:MAG: pilus assembly protein PilM [Elusimicrobiales bacterium]
MSMLDNMMGKRAVTLTSCLGMYLTMEEIGLVETQLGGGAVKIGRYVRIALPPPKKSDGDARASAMNADFITKEANWLPHLEKAIKQVDLDTRKVMLALSPQFAVFRYFLMPMVERRFWKQSIPLEAKKYVPFPFETSIYDFQVHMHDLPDGRGRMMGVIFALTSAKIVESLVEGVKKAGLEPVGVEVSAMSAGRLLGHACGGTTAPRIYAHFDASSAYMLLYNNGVPLLFREVNFGDTMGTKRRRLDVKGPLDFVHKQFGEQIFKELYLSGENLDVWKSSVLEDAKLPLKMWDPKAAFKLRDGNWGMYSAIGAGIRHMTGEAGVDLLHTTSAAVDEARVSLTVWAVAIGMVVISGLMAFSAQARFFMATMELSRLRASISEVPEFSGLTSDGIQQAVDSIRAYSGKLQALGGNPDYYAPKLVAVLDSVPDKVWVSDVGYSGVLPSAGSRGESELSITGKVRSGSAQNDVAIVQTFIDTLKANPEIQKAFIAPGGQCLKDFVTSRSQDRSAQDSAADTNFSIKCKVQPGGGF